MEYRIDPKNFSKGVQYARKFNGTYNPTTKTWTIPTHNNGVENYALNAPKAYGLIPVAVAPETANVPWFLNPRQV